MEAQRLAGLPRVNRNGLCGRLLLRHILVLRIFRLVVRGRLFSAIQLQDRFEPALKDFVLHAVFVVFAAAKLALDRDVLALLQARGEFPEFAEGEAAVPFGPRFPFAVAVLPRALRGNREYREGRSVVTGLRLGVAAGESDESKSVEVRDVFSPVLPVCPGARKAERPPLPRPGVAFLGGPEWGSQNRNGAERRSRDSADRRARELARSCAQDRRTDQEGQRAQRELMDAGEAPVRRRIGGSVSRYWCQRSE